MTLTDEVLSAMECSNAYCNNAQVVILPADSAEDYPDAASMSELNFAVESGSAGEAMAIENGFSYTPVVDQATAVLEVSSGTCQAAIIDSLMANEVITLVKDTSLARIISYQEVIWAGYAFLKGSHGYSGLIWPLFFTGVYYLIFNGVVSFLLARLERKLEFFR